MSILVHPQEWIQSGVQHKHIVVTDRQSPELVDITECIRMIEDLSSKKHSIYVHCKAGKGRSATLVACYLLKVSCLSSPCTSSLIMVDTCTYIHTYICMCTYCMYIPNLYAM